MPIFTSWLQVFLGIVHVVIVIGAIFAWLKFREQAKAATAVHRAARELHSAQTESALWQEINALRREMGQLKDELALVRQEKHDWRGRANKWKLWYTIARGQTQTLRTLLDACREQNALLREKLHLPSIVLPNTDELLGQELPTPESMTDPVEDVSSPQEYPPDDYVQDDGQPQ